MSKIIQISTSRGVDDAPIFYALFEDGSVKMFSHQYGWENVPLPAPPASKGKQ